MLNKSRVRASLQTYSKDGFKPIDLELSIALTDEIRRLNPDFSSIKMIVRKDKRRHEHSADTQIDTDKRTRRTIEVPCHKSGELFLEILRNPMLSEFINGIEGIVYHEKVHLKSSRKAPCYKNGKRYEFLCENSEIMAELTALAKAKNPLDEVAAYLAMRKYIEGSQNLRRDLLGKLCHWSEIEEYKTGKVYEAGEVGVKYRFPINDKALKEITKRSKELCDKLIELKRGGMTNLPSLRRGA